MIITPCYIIIITSSSSSSSSFFFFTYTSENEDPALCDTMSGRCVLTFQGTLTVETAGFSKTPAHVYQTMRCQILQEGNHYISLLHLNLNMMATPELSSLVYQIKFRRMRCRHVRNMQEQKMHGSWDSTKR